MTSHEKNFDYLVGQVTLAYKQFLLFKELRKPSNRKLLNSHGYFFKVILPTLSISFLSNLSKILEAPHGFDETVSIFTITKQRFVDQEEIISKIKKLRNKVLAHNDMKTLQDLDKFMRELQLKNENIEDLFIQIIDYLNEQRVHFGLSGEFAYFKDQLPEYAKRSVDDLLKVIPKAL